MHVTVTDAYGHRFVQLAAEGRPELDPTAALRELIERFARELVRFGLSLDDTVRTRLWARSAEDRTAASTERRSLLANRARSSSSSYIAPGRLASAAGVGLDLLALRPAQRGEKIAVEYDPPAAPPRYVLYGDMLFCSGVSPRVPTIEEAVRAAFAEHAESLRRAELTWQNAVQVAVYANRRYALAQVEELVRAALPVRGIPTDYVFVDGHAGADAHVEIELTARRAPR